VIMLVLFPYYNKEAIEYQQQVKKLEEKVLDSEKKLSEAKKKQEALEVEKKELKQNNEELEKKVEDAVKFALLGIESRSDSFVILIDLSGSLEKYVETVKRIFNQIIHPMKQDQKMQIIGFHTSEDGTPLLPRWQDSGELASMSPNNKERAINFVESLMQRIGGLTPTGVALSEALNYPTGAIILMTDGAPTEGTLSNYGMSDTNKIISEITRKNKGEKEIHSVAIGSYASDTRLTDFLQNLSSENEGGFLGVAK
jgi:VWA domain-containing protein